MPSREKVVMLTHIYVVTFTSIRLWKTREWEEINVTEMLKWLDWLNCSLAQLSSLKNFNNYFYHPLESNKKRPFILNILKSSGPMGKLFYVTTCFILRSLEYHCKVFGKRNRITKLGIATVASPNIYHWQFQKKYNETTLLEALSNNEY